MLIVPNLIFIFSDQSLYHKFIFLLKPSELCIIRWVIITPNIFIEIRSCYQVLFILIVSPCNLLLLLGRNMPTVINIMNSSSMLKNSHLLVLKYIILFCRIGRLCMVLLITVRNILKIMHLLFLKYVFFLKNTTFGVCLRLLLIFLHIAVILVDVNDFLTCVPLQFRKCYGIYTIIIMVILICLFLPVFFHCFICYQF